MYPSRARQLTGVDSYLSYGADLGYQQKMGMLAVCPIASYALSDLPDGFGINNSASTATIGLAIGVVVGPPAAQNRPDLWDLPGV